MTRAYKRRRTRPEAERGTGTASIGSGGYDRSTQGTGGGGSPSHMSSQVGREVPNGQMEGSPMQKMAGSAGVPNIDSSRAVHRRGQATETSCSGKLDRYYSDFDTPTDEAYTRSKGHSSSSSPRPH